MRTQPQTIINLLEADNSRLAKEAILAKAVKENLTEFFDGVRLALDQLYTFGVKQVPIKEVNEGQGLSWDNFLELEQALHKRSLTGHAARDAIQLAMDVATQEQWNNWYRRILIKDLRCGVSEKTVNKVLKGSAIAPIPVFECMLAHDSQNHPAKVNGLKIVQKKLDGVRCLTVVDFESRLVTMYTRNGKELVNFPHIIKALEDNIDNFGRSYVIDGEIMSVSFQDLMKQLHRKSNTTSDDATLCVFDIIPLHEFKTQQSTMGQRRRLNFITENFEPFLHDTKCIAVVPWKEFDLSTTDGQAKLSEFNTEVLNEGYEGVMLKDPDAKYEFKRSVAWLKTKPFIDVSLTVVDVEEGTGKNTGVLGALVCEGTDDGKFIKTNVGSGLTDEQRLEIWNNQHSVIGQVIEVRADAITINQDSDTTYSLRFPRIKTFRGFDKGEKI